MATRQTTDFPAGGVLTDAMLDNEFTEIFTNITNDNIAGGANIAISKTALGTFTDWTSWSPTITPAGAMTWSLTTNINSYYCQIGKMVFLNLAVKGTMGGVANTNISFVPPVTPHASWLSSNSDWIMKAGIVDNFGVYAAAKVIDAGSATSFYLYREDVGNFTNLGANYTLTATGFYRAA